MADHERLRTQVLAILDAFVQECADDLPDASRAALAAHRARLTAGQCRVVLCGEFGHGKSTLLNSLVERTDLFPDGDLSATSVVTTLSWGEQETATAVRTGGPDRPLSRQPISLAEARRLCTAADAGDLVAIELTAPIAALEQGMVLVDTPGIGRLDAAHTAATYGFLARADALLLVARIQPPLSASQLKLFADAVGHSPAFITVLTQADLVDQDAVDGYVVEARKRLAEALDHWPGTPVVLPVSAHNALDGRLEHDPTLVVESGVPVLAAQIRRRLVGSVVLGWLAPVLSELAEELRLVLAPVHNERAALTGDQQRAETQQLLARMRDQLAVLSPDGRAWRDQLLLDVYRAAEPALRQMAERFAALRLELAVAAEREVPDPDPERWTRRVQQEIVATAAHADAGLHNAVARVARQWSARSSVALTVAEAGTSFVTAGHAGGSGHPQITAGAVLAGVPGNGPPGCGPPGDGRQPARLASVRYGFVSAFGPAGSAASAGGVIGTIVTAGSPVGGAVGAVIGGVVGHLVGWIRNSRVHIAQARREQRQQQIDALAELLRQAVAEHEAYAIEAFTSARDRAGELLAAELASQVSAEQDAISISLRRAAAVADRDEPDRQARLRAVDARHTTLTELEARIRSTAAEVAALREELDGPAAPGEG